MKPTAPERFAVKAVAAAAALILAMTAQALPLSYLIELERAKIEPAAKLFQQECGDHTDSQACKEQRDALVKVLNGFVSMVRKELALLQILGFYGRSCTVEHDLAAKSCKTTQHVETIVWPIYLA